MIMYCSYDAKVHSPNPAKHGKDCKERVKIISIDGARIISVDGARIIRVDGARIISVDDARVESSLRS